MAEDRDVDVAALQATAAELEAIGQRMHRSHGEFVEIFSGYSGAVPDGPLKDALADFAAAFGASSRETQRELREMRTMLHDAIDDVPPQPPE